MLASSILRMVIVRIPEDHGWVPTYPTSGTAIEFQFLSLFVVVSFLKVRVRARFADPVTLRHRRYWFAIRLPDNRHHLLFREPALPHCSLRIGSQSLN